MRAILIVLFAALLASCGGESSSTASTRALPLETTPQPLTPDPEPEPPAPPTPQTTWRTINFVDEFGDFNGRGAVSDSVSSRRPMSFPYSDVTARLFVDCDSAWIRFSDSPNLTDGDIASGYNSYSLPVRVDGNDEGRWRARQSFGDSDLRFESDATVIAAWSSGTTFAIALPWYGEQAVAFQWDLEGSTAAIQASCE